jgi:hypothetical protein
LLSTASKTVSAVAVTSVGVPGLQQRRPPAHQQGLDPRAQFGAGFGSRQPAPAGDECPEVLLAQVAVAVRVERGEHPGELALLKHTGHERPPSTPNRTTSRPRPCCEAADSV